MSALRDAFDTLRSRRIVLFGGKGGVGKTTMAALAALHFSASRKVILFTTDPASNLADLFTHPATRQPGNLITESLDAQSLYTRFLEHNLPSFLELGDRGTYLDREELRRFFELALPGVDELMAWSRIGELAEEHADAMVVVDTAPTGHTLRMLSSGEHFAQLGRALDAMQEKHRNIVRQLTRRDPRDAMDAFIERFEADAERHRELLRQSAFVPVALSEPLVVAQTKRLIGEVRPRASGLGPQAAEVPFVVLNRTAPDCGCARCREQARRDADARRELANVVDAPRSCVPLDSVEALIAFLADARPSPGASRHPLPAGEGVELSSTLPLPPGEGGRRPGEGRANAQIVFFAGKGGVGKTTLSVSHALRLAQEHPERRYVIISVDPAHSLRDVFASQAPPANLSVEMIDTRARWRAFRDQLGEEIERAVNAMTPSGLTVAYDTDAMKQLIEVAPPGADELFAISRLADLTADESVAETIVDTAPTGHFLRLLDLPKTAGEWVREFMRILLRYRELVPAGTLGEELLRASRALHSLDATLHSERASVVVVTRPERIVVAETRRLIDELHQRRIRVSRVIANYVTPQSDCKCDQSMRGFEEDALRALGSEIARIDRRDTPPSTLSELSSLNGAEAAPPPQ
ncbi:MAG TPA: TRC40/GET3/ArsA family transport-energizing ATPase [Thermoanaerobaculia bacterium]|nr:TRC40/GET3/ArsA family transport-energizing ATPase [Thermoanaerobaculia bacterium]